MARATAAAMAGRADVARQVQLTRATLRPRRPVPGMGVLDPSVTRMRVRPGDLDFYLHVNNGTYLQMMDVARSNYIADVGGFPLFNERRWYPVVASQTVTYKRSLTLGQRFDVETRMIGLDERAVWFEQRVVVDGDVAVRAYICTRLRKKDGRPVENDEVRAIAAAAGHDLAGEPTLPEWLHEWRRSVALPSARTPLPHTWDLDTVRRG